jgi:hypothetical protein
VAKEAFREAEEKRQKALADNAPEAAKQYEAAAVYVGFAAKLVSWREPCHGWYSLRNPMGHYGIR